MIKDLGLFSWRIGLILVFGLPLLYACSAVITALFRNDNLIAQIVLAVQMFVPSIFTTIAFGCALCLLVRIEAHLRALRIAQAPESTVVKDAAIAQEGSGA